MTNIRNVFGLVLLAVLALALAVPANAQFTAINNAPGHAYGVFATTEGNGGAFFAEAISTNTGFYNKTVVNFSGSDSTGAKCIVVRPNCSATSTVTNGVEKIIAESANGMWSATCDGEGGVSASGPNVGFAWGGGCHGWYQFKPGLFIGFSPRWTKDNVGPNSGKLTFNIDFMHTTK